MVNRKASIQVTGKTNPRYVNMPRRMGGRLHNKLQHNGSYAPDCLKINSLEDALVVYLLCYTHIVQMNLPPAPPAKAPSTKAPSTCVAPAALNSEPLKEVVANPPIYLDKTNQLLVAETSKGKAVVDSRYCATDKTNRKGKNTHASLEKKQNNNTNSDISLHEAVENGDEIMVEKLIKKGASIRARNKYSLTPLQHATNKKHIAIMKLLLKAEVTPGIEDITSWDPFYIAVIKREVSVIQCLVDHTPSLIDAPLADGRTALHIAAGEGSCETIHMLLYKGANPNIRDNEGNLPLHMAVNRNHISAVKILLEHKDKSLYLDVSAKLSALWYGDQEAGVNAKGAYGYTALHIAARNGNADMVNILIERKARKDVINDAGETPLHVAVINKHVLQKLIYSDEVTIKDKSGYTALVNAIIIGERNIISEICLDNRRIASHINIRDHKGLTPLHHALRWYCSYGESTDYQRLKMLVANTADVNAPMPGGETPLHYAVRNKNIEAVTILLAVGKANITNEDIRAAIDHQNIEIIKKLLAPDRLNNPLHVAIRKNLIEAVEILIKEDPSQINTPSNDGQTALHVAVNAGNYLITNMLLIKSADMTITNRQKKTPFDIAIEEQKEEIVALFVRDINDADEKGWNPLSRATKANRQNQVETLLAYGANVNAIVASNNWTVLLEAVRHGKKEIAKMLLNHNANVNWQSAEGWTALHIAVNEGYIEIVRMLLDKGAEILIKNNDQRTAIDLAIRRENEAIRSLLVNRLNLPDKDGKTLLYKAVVNDQESKVLELLNYGVDVNVVVDPYGWTALFKAVNDGNERIIEMLLRYNADVNLPTNDSWTAFTLAARHGKKEIAEMLLSHNANVNYQLNEGWTALHMAVNEGYIEIVRMLLDRGAEILIKKNDQKTAIDLAIRRENEAIRSLLVNRLNLPDKDGKTLLYKAVVNDQESKVLELLNYGVDLNVVVDPNGWTALLQAARHDKKEIIKMLLSHNANVNYQLNDGWTALHMAVNEGYIEIVRMLLDKGAEILIKNNYQKTAIDLAIERENEAIRSLLLDRLNLPDKDGKTLLYKAVINDQESKVLELLNYGVDVNVQLTDDLTVLHIATTKVNLSIVRLLLDNGADVTKNTKSGNTPLHMIFEYIKKNYHVRIDEFGYSVWGKTDPTIICDLLVEKMPSTHVNILNPEKQSYLLLAAEYATHNVVGALVKKGARMSVMGGAEEAGLFYAIKYTKGDFIPAILDACPESRLMENKDGLLPIHYAAERGELFYIEKLLDNYGHSADIPTKKEKNTILHILVKNNYHSAIAALIGKCNPNAINAEGKTPLEMAVSLGYVESSLELLKDSRTAATNDILKKLDALEESVEKTNDGLIEALDSRHIRLIEEAIAHSKTHPAPELFKKFMDDKDTVILLKDEDRENFFSHINSSKKYISGTHDVYNLGNFVIKHQPETTARAIITHILAKAMGYEHLTTKMKTILVASGDKEGAVDRYILAEKVYGIELQEAKKTKKFFKEKFSRENLFEHLLFSLLTIPGDAKSDNIIAQFNLAADQPPSLENILTITCRFIDQDNFMGPKFRGNKGAINQSLLRSSLMDRVALSDISAKVKDAFINLKPLEVLERVLDEIEAINAQVEEKIPAVMLKESYSSLLLSFPVKEIPENIFKRLYDRMVVIQNALVQSQGLKGTLNDLFAIIDPVSFIASEARKHNSHRIDLLQVVAANEPYSRDFIKNEMEYEQAERTTQKPIAEIREMLRQYAQKALPQNTDLPQHTVCIYKKPSKAISCFVSLTMGRKGGINRKNLCPNREREDLKLTL